MELLTELEVSSLLLSKLTFEQYCGIPAALHIATRLQRAIVNSKEATINTIPAGQ